MYYKLYYDLESGEQFIIKNQTDPFSSTLVTKIFNFDGTKNVVALDLGIETTKVIIELLDSDNIPYYPSNIQIVLNQTIVIEHAENLTGKAVVTFL
jgi:hypothetical protein